MPWTRHQSTWTQIPALAGETLGKLLFPPSLGFLTSYVGLRVTPCRFGAIIHVKGEEYKAANKSTGCGVNYLSSKPSAGHDTLGKLPDFAKSYLTCPL